MPEDLQEFAEDERIMEEYVDKLERYLGELAEKPGMALLLGPPLDMDGILALARFFINVRECMDEHKVGSPLVLVQELVRRRDKLREIRGKVLAIRELANTNGHPESLRMAVEAIHRLADEILVVQPVK